MGTVSILLALLDLIPRITKTAANLKKELTRSGEMSAEEVAEVNRKWEAAFASDHWKKETP